MRALLLTLMLLPALAMADVTLKTEAFRIVAVAQNDGSTIEEWQPAGQAVPGDQIGFRISYSNEGSERATAVLINNPIPEDAVYIANSATGAGSTITYSVDGGNTFAAASQLTVKENGEDRPAKAEDFTNVRWQLTQPVEAGASGKVEYQVRIK